MGVPDVRYKIEFTCHVLFHPKFTYIMEPCQTSELRIRIDAALEINVVAFLDIPWLELRSQLKTYDGRIYRLMQILCQSIYRFQSPKPQLTENAHVPVVLDEHSRHVWILRMARQSLSVVLNRRHEVQYRCGLIVFTVIAYTLERLFPFQPRDDGVGSRASRHAMNLILSIRNKC